jgi:hypothetical protein
MPALVSRCCLAGALTPLSAVAHAGSAPKEFYGKSIVVRSTESFSAKLATERATAYRTRRRGRG